MTLGFVGLGIMGSGMAGNLLAAGHPLLVWNRTAASARPLAQAGAQVAGSPREVAEHAEIVFTCVSDTPDVEQVLLGADGIASGAREGTLVVDMSTISPAATRAMGAELARRELRFLDAPVSGGSEGAQLGTLTIMVGAAEEDLARARPYLEAMGSAITHVGPVGAGQTCKLANQILVVVTMLGVSEALLFAQAGGLDPADAIAAVAGGAGGSWMLANRGPQAVERDWRPGFTVDLQQKDLRLVLEAAEEYGVPLVGTAMVHQLYRTLQAAGLGGQGNHALVQALERLSGLRLGQSEAEATGGLDVE